MKKRAKEMDPGMADPGFPVTHTTTTTTTTTTTKIQVQLRFDPLYIRTIPGILKLVQMLLNIIGYISIMVSTISGHSRAGWFGFVSMTGFWVTGILLLFYIMHVVEKFQMVPWLKIEFGYTALWTFFYLTAASACAAWGNYYTAWAVGAFFGFCAMIAYGVDAFFKFKGMRAGDMAQGERNIEIGGQDLQSPGAY